MKLVAFASFKGGAGKTTALMAAAAGLDLLGKRTAIFEADDNRPIGTWRDAAVREGYWSDNVTVLPADEMDALERSFDEAQKTGVEVGLIDTQGGASDFNGVIIANADLIVVPTALTPLDINAALDTFEYTLKLLDDVDSNAKAMILIQSAKPRMTSSEMEAFRGLSKLPMFEFVMRERNAFAAMGERGLLHRYQAVQMAQPGLRLTARQYDIAVSEAQDFVTELDANVGGF